MSLTCNHDDDGGAEWYYIQAEELAPLDTKRSRRCCSCDEKIAVGQLATKYTRFRGPRTHVEERIYGEDGEIYMADQYMCEPCTDLADNLGELGYCTPPGDDMRELVKEYAEMVKAEQEQNAGFKSGKAGEPLPENPDPNFRRGWWQGNAIFRRT